MAVITRIAAGNVIGRFAFCDCAVMTRATGSQDSIVVDSRDVLEARGRVAILADIRGVNVRGVFACRIYAIVARRAVAGDGTVIELGIAPRVGVMAVVTSVRTLYVRGGFTLSNRSIVA